MARYFLRCDLSVERGRCKIVSKEKISSWNFLFEARQNECVAQICSFFN